MKWLKHILVVIALLFAALPCTHALDHIHSAEPGDAPVEIDLSGHCSCHACGDSVCTEKYEVVQDLSAVSSVAAKPSSPIVLFVFTETRPVLKRVDYSSTAPLIALQTIQLLI